MNIKSLAVFCGSKEGKNKLYVDDAVRIGKLLAAKNITLVYGGGGFGIMGAIANAVLSGKGKVIGVMPKLLTGWEVAHDSLSEFYEVENMHTRKMMMYEKCDAAIILAGGFGTLDELFEILTWNQLKIHNKKIFILNTGGFYDHLIAHIEKMRVEGFLHDPVLENIKVINHPIDLEPYLI